MPETASLDHEGTMLAGLFFPRQQLVPGLTLRYDQTPELIAGVSEYASLLSWIEVGGGNGLLH